MIQDCSEIVSMEKPGVFISFTSESKGDYFQSSGTLGMLLIDILKYGGRFSNFIPN
jgi:hypothetical protein